MQQIVHWFRNRFFSGDLSFRQKIFNLLGIAGIIISLISAVAGVFERLAPLNILINLMSAAVACFLLYYSKKSGRYELCFIITIAIVFLLFFPMFFFTSGGYHSGIPCFFVFAVIFTVFMLDGKKMFIMAGLEFLFYIALFVYAYLHPESVHSFDSEAGILTDVIIGFVAVSLSLGVTMYIQLKMYNAQQRQLALQNETLEQISRMKTELLATMSHEMKTPLTVVSVHIQRAQAFSELGRPGDAEKVQESHALAQDEIMRLSRLVDGALRLSSLQEHGEQRTTDNADEIIRTTAEAYRTLLEKHGNRLTISLPDELPTAGCGADEMVQILSNLLSNANAHTQEGEIAINAKSSESFEIIVTDNGDGISAELLPHVLERGVSGGDGSGLGLAICQELARSCGGDILITSEENRGTTVTFNIPIAKEVARHAKRETAAR